MRGGKRATIILQLLYLLNIIANIKDFQLTVKVQSGTKLGLEYKQEGSNGKWKTWPASVHKRGPFLFRLKGIQYNHNSSILYVFYALFSHMLLRKSYRAHLYNVYYVLLQPLGHLSNNDTLKMVQLWTERKRV